MDAPLLTGGRPSSEVASVQERRRTTAAACCPAGQRRSVVVGAGPNWSLCRLSSTADGPSAGPATDKNFKTLKKEMEEDLKKWENDFQRLQWRPQCSSGWSS